MKPQRLLIILVIALFVFFMLGGFGSLAGSGSNAGGRSAQSGQQSEQGESSATPQGEMDEQDDPDLPSKFHKKIDKEAYLRARDEFVALKRGMEPDRPFDPMARGRAILQMERQEKGRRIESMINGSLTPPVTTDAAWTPLGPSPLPINSFGSGPFSGRVTSVVVDPTNQNKVYLGAAQGGVWRSLDGGATWVSIFDGAQSQAIGALAMSLQDPTKLYVGTGEFNGCGDCFFGVGLYRIDTVDTTPTLVGPINPSITTTAIGGGPLTYNIFTGRGITKIVVDPNNANNIFVATGRGIGGSGANSLGLVGGVPSLAPRGLYRSMNATSSPASSVTFQKLVVTTDNSPDSPGTGNEDTPDIVMDPGNPNNIIAASAGPSGTAFNSGIYRTTNALAATPSFTQVLTLPNNIRVSLAINKVAGVVTAYAATSETPTNTPGCTTALSGAVRKQIDPFNSSSTWATQLAGGGGFCSGQCFYDMPIAVDPTNANVVYIGGQSSSTCGGVVRKSTDGGASFANDSSGLHADDHTLFVDPLTSPATLYTGNDGGVWKQSSNAATTGSWTNLNNAPLNTLQFQGIAVHPFDRNLMIGGTQDNGTEYQQTSGGNWHGAEGGDGGYALIDQSATNTTDVTMYHTFYNITGDQIGFDRALNTSCLTNFNFWPSRGIGMNPALGDPEQPSLTCDGTANYLHNGLNLSDSVLFYAPMALGPGSPNTLYFGTDRLYRSTDRGDNMTVVSQPPIVSTGCGSTGTSPCPISTIAISPQDDAYRIVGLQNGQVWATSTGSSTLVNITGAFPTNPNLSTNRFVGRAVIDPNNKNVAYIAFSFFAPAGQGVWKITNLTAAVANPASANWVAMGSGIPSIPINALAVDPDNSNNIFAGTDIGVYNSTDGGASWVPFGTGLPRSAVFDLALQKANRVLRAGTHGRGVWEISLAARPHDPIQLSFLYHR